MARRIPHQYPDTPDGARQLLEDEADLAQLPGLADARYAPDPHIPGCWLVSCPDWAVLVYVGAHPAAPDFEEVDTVQAERAQDRFR